MVGIVRGYDRLVSLCGQAGVWILALTILFGACADAAEPSAEAIRSVSVGVSSVRNPSSDRELAWEFERLFALGGVDEGPAAFFRVFPSSIGVDADGNLYVLDAGNYTVAKFDPTGRHIRSFGRQGEGPGEFGFPSDMAVHRDGSVAVYDFDGRGLSRFDPDGEFTGTLPLPGPLQRQVALLDAGHVVAAVTQGTPSPDSTDLKLLVIREEEVELTNVRQFTRPEPREFSCGSRPGVPYFGPRVVWAAAGGRVAFSDDETYSVQIVEPDGATGVWARDLPPIRSTLELAAWEVADGDSLRSFGCSIAAEEAARQFGYGDVAPTVESLSVAPDGGVWVRRRTEVPGDLLTDVFDASGTYLGTLPIGSPFPAVFRGADEIVTVEHDDLSRPLVVAYRIDKGQ